MKFIRLLKSLIFSKEDGGIKDILSFPKDNPIVYQVIKIVNTNCKKKS